MTSPKPLTGNRRVVSFLGLFDFIQEVLGIIAYKYFAD